MEKNFELKVGNSYLEIVPFDNEKEIRLQVTEDVVQEIYLSPKKLNTLMIYLASQLKAIGEPCDLLDKVL